jgi:hypothetical protein
VPLAKLFVEGNLEAEVLNPILQGNPVLQRGGSKYALRPRALADRRENRVSAGYLRDRDFDFDPPADLTKPAVDSEEAGIPFGWRWCRHELENYFLEPEIVSVAMGWPKREIEEALAGAALKIRSYEAARWTIGVVRRSLPPNYELHTRPERLGELALPSALDAASVAAWASNVIGTHRGRILVASDQGTVQSSLAAFTDRFNEALVTDSAQSLVWFSGKDLLAGLAEWLATKAVSSPGVLRASVRDWIIANPNRALELLPEWNGLLRVIRA